MLVIVICQYIINHPSTDYPYELRQALDGKLDTSDCEDLEQLMVSAFCDTAGGPGGTGVSARQWREGSEKSSFTYLLLDPRVSDNLPLRAKSLSKLVC